MQAADAEVEYEIETEEGGKVKAVNVTGPGGALIKQPPRRERRPRRSGKKENAENEDDAPQESAPPKKESKAKGGGRNTPPFHDVIDSEVKEKIEASGLSLGRKTVVDIAMGDSRFRLGQEGYASEVVATGKVGEGTFTCDAAGVVTFTWERALEYVDEKWVAGGMKTLTTSVSLAGGTCCDLHCHTHALTCLAKVDSLQWKTVKLWKVFGAKRRQILRTR